MDVELDCPWCGIRSSVESVVFHYSSRDGGGRYLYTVAVCPARDCDRASFLIITDPYKRFFDYVEIYAAKVFPNAHADYAPEGVPEQIAMEFCEALECGWAGHDIAAALVGRRVLQAAARDVIGTKLKNLQEEIEAIPDDRLNKALKEQAHHVRLIGNDAAHVDPVAKEDVEDLLAFVEQVLDALYVGPTKVAKLQAKRDAAKAAKAPKAPKPTP